MQPSGNSLLDSYRGSSSFGQQPAAPVSQQAAPAHHGFLGSLYDTVFKPVVDTATGLPGDIYHGGTALGIAGKSMLSGEKGAALAQSKQAALSEMKKTPGYGQFFGDTVDQNNASSAKKQFEQIGGKAISNVANAEAFNPGGVFGAVTGASKLARVGSAAKVGAKFGATQGAAQQMQQGGDLASIAGGAAKGGIAGGLTGGALQGAGGILANPMSKLAGKVSGKTVPTAAGDIAQTARTSSNPLTNMLNRKATGLAQKTYNEQVMHEFGTGGKTVSDNGVPLNTVLGQMNDHNIQPGVVNMAKYGNAGFGYNDLLEGKIIPQGTPVRVDAGEIVTNAMKSQPGLTVPKGFTGRLTRIISDSLDPQHENISGAHLPGDILHAAQELYGAKPASAAEAAVYDNARKGLINSAAKDGGLNTAIKNTKLPSVADLKSGVASSDPEAATTEHFLSLAGGNETLAQEMVDNVNKAQTLQEIQKAELKHIAANQIADSHAQSIGQSLPKPTNSSGRYSLMGNGGISTAYELGMAAHGNVAAYIPLAAKAGGGSVIGKMMGKLGTADMSQVGPRVGPDLSNLGPEAAPQANELAAPAPAPVEQAPAEPAPAPVPTDPADLLGQAGGTPTKIGFDGQTQPYAVPVTTPQEVPTGPAPLDLRSPAPTTPGAINLRQPAAQPTQTVQTPTSPVQPVAQTSALAGSVTPGQSADDAAREIFRNIKATQGERNRAAMEASQAAQAARAPQGPPPPAAAPAPSNGGPLGMLSSLTPSSGDLLGGMRNATAGNAGASAGQPAPALVPYGPNQAAPTGAAGTLAGITSGAGQNQQQSVYSQENLTADITRDPKNASTYMQIYKLYNPDVTKAPLSATQTTSAMGIRDAAGGIQNYVQGIQALQKSGHAGYGTGAVNSILGRMGIGADNSQVYALDSQKVDLATQLAKATTNGKPSAQMIKQWEESLPSVNDPASVVQDKLNSLATNLDTYYTSATTPISVGQ